MKLRRIGIILFLVSFFLPGFFAAAEPYNQGNFKPPGPGVEYPPLESSSLIPKAELEKISHLFVRNKSFAKIRKHWHQLVIKNKKMNINASLAYIRQAARQELFEAGADPNSLFIRQQLDQLRLDALAIRRLPAQSLK